MNKSTTYRVDTPGNERVVLGCYQYTGWELVYYGLQDRRWFAKKGNMPIESPEYWCEVPAFLPRCVMKE